jgi:hypothetical protein
MADPKKIAGSRDNLRKNQPMDVQQTQALEQIADTLEAIRIDLARFQASYFQRR